MNKGIAHELMLKIGSLNFIDLYGSIVSTVEHSDVVMNDGRQRTIVTKIPATCDVLDYSKGCSNEPNSLVDMVPNSKRKGILYFEDNGTEVLGRTGVFFNYRSNLRIVVWVNTDYIDLNSCYGVSMPLLTAIINRIAVNPYNSGNYLKVTTRVVRILKADDSIFSKYTFPKTATQYLMPPFEFFALDIEVSFSINPECIEDIKTKEPEC